MDKFIEKLSRYHLLTNLIPGILFLYLLDILGIYSIDLNEWLNALCMGYFAGMVISRVSSIVIEPWFRKWKIVKYAPYPDFLKAEKEDTKLSELLADNNMYRTFVAMLMLLALLEVGHLIPVVDDFLHSSWAAIVMITLLLLLYVLAYRKQTNYIRERVGKLTKDK